MYHEWLEVVALDFYESALWKVLCQFNPKPIAVGITEEIIVMNTFIDECMEFGFAVVGEVWVYDRYFMRFRLCINGHLYLS